MFANLESIAWLAVNIFCDVISKKPGDRKEFQEDFNPSSCIGFESWKLGKEEVKMIRVHWP